MDAMRVTFTVPYNSSPSIPTLLVRPFVKITCHDTSINTLLCFSHHPFREATGIRDRLITMDISDILQGLSSRRDPFAEDGDDSFEGGRGQGSGQADLQALTRAWVNERGTAELLL